MDQPVACFKQEEQTKLMFIFFSNGNGSAFEDNLDSGLLSQVERSFNAVSALCVAVERRGSTLT